jgi:hypothetical protein
VTSKVDCSGTKGFHPSKPLIQGVVRSAQGGQSLAIAREVWVSQKRSKNMKLSRTLLAAALLSVGSAAHALVLDFNTLTTLRGSSASFLAVSMSPYVFNVTGSVESGGGRSFNSVVLSESGFGIDSSFDTGNVKDLVNRYEVLTFTFTTPTVVNLSDVVFTKKNGEVIITNADYEYSVDSSGSWTRNGLNENPDFDPELQGTSFSFRYFATNGGDGNTSFFVSSLDVSTPVAPIPEPETYALMIAGLGLVGLMARRRKVMQGASA